MKRAVLFVLMALYTVSATGASFHLHFCGGYLINISVFDHDDDGCCKGKQHHTSDVGFILTKKCCEDNISSVSIKSDQLGKSQSSSLVVPVIDVVNSASSPFIVQSKHVSVVPSWHSPPERQCGEVYLVNCSFRI